MKTTDSVSSIAPAVPQDEAELVASVQARYPGADCAPRPDVLPVVRPDHAKPEHLAWAVVVGDLFGCLMASGFTILKVDNGDGWEGGDTLECVSLATACDDAHVRVSKGGEGFTIFLVLGNAPAELVADYSCRESLIGREFDSLLSSWSDSWLDYDDCPTWGEVAAGWVKA